MRLLCMHKYMHILFLLATKHHNNNISNMNNNCIASGRAHATHGISTTPATTTTATATSLSTATATAT